MNQWWTKMGTTKLYFVSNPLMRNKISGSKERLMLKADMEAKLIEMCAFCERIAKKLGNISAELYNTSDDIKRDLGDGKDQDRRIIE